MASHRYRTRKRLTGFDYRMPGPYWVTICLHRRQPWFGEVGEDGVSLSPTGQMIADTWIALPHLFPTVQLDAFIVMPDHLHGILSLHDGTGPDLSSAPSLGSVIGAFKSVTTTRYIRGVRDNGWPAYDRYFWLEDYYEHIIRDERDLEAKRRYVERNPARWREKRDG